MQLPSNGQVLRQRHGRVREIVQGFDAFGKVTDDVKEEQKAVNGLLTLLCFSLIIVLIFGELYNYFTNTEVEYRFSVDTDLNDNPVLDINMIVASPCNNLAIMPMGIDSIEKTEGNTHLKKKPSRFEMEPDEEKLWAALKRVHRENFKPGAPLKAINQIRYVGSNVEEGLEEAAKQKEHLEKLELERQKAELSTKVKDEGLEEHVIMMIGNGMGVFQIIASKAGDSDEVEQGSACHISGKISVLKGQGDRLIITVGKSLPIGNMIQHLGPHQHGNISHRIERFHFGPHIWGLVSPLAGNEQFANKPGTTFKYFLKVVPTRIYSRGLFGQSYLNTYQYAVTYMKKEAEPGEHIHDSIVFDYEFLANVIEVHPVSVSILQLSLRICSIIGGIFATSSFIAIYIEAIVLKMFSIPAISRLIWKKN